jgi:hypothetical protein
MRLLAHRTRNLPLQKNPSPSFACSRVIPFDSYITNPYYALGPLYYATTATSVETSLEKKIADLKTGL